MEVTEDMAIRGRLPLVGESIVAPILRKFRAETALTIREAA